MEIPDQYQFLDYGMDLYAPQTNLDQEGRRVMMAWVRMPQVTEGGWIGMFCSPRVVEVREGHICFRMHPHIRRAYSREIPDPSWLRRADIWRPLIWKKEKRRIWEASVSAGKRQDPHRPDRCLPLF